MAATWFDFGCRVDDVAAGGEVHSRGVIVHKKTGRPVQFEITEQTRRAIAAWIDRHRLRADDYLFLTFSIGRHDRRRRDGPNVDARSGSRCA